MSSGALQLQGWQWQGPSGAAGPAAPSHGDEHVNGDVGQCQAVAARASPQLPVGRERGEPSGKARHSMARASMTWWAQHGAAWRGTARHIPGRRLPQQSLPAAADGQARSQPALSQAKERFKPSDDALGSKTSRVCWSRDRVIVTWRGCARARPHTPQGVPAPLTCPQTAQRLPAPAFREAQLSWDSRRPQWGTSEPAVPAGSSCPDPGRVWSETSKWVSWVSTGPPKMAKAQGERGGTPARLVMSTLPTLGESLHSPKGPSSLCPTLLRVHDPTDAASAASQWHSWVLKGPSVPPPRSLRALRCCC